MTGSPGPGWRIAAGTACGLAAALMTAVTAIAVPTVLTSAPASSGERAFGIAFVVCAASYAVAGWVAVAAAIRANHRTLRLAALGMAMTVLLPLVTGVVLLVRDALDGLSSTTAGSGTLYLVPALVVAVPPLLAWLAARAMRPAEGAP